MQANLTAYDVAEVELFQKTSSPWTELGNDLIDVSPTWGTGLENNFVKENVYLVYGD